MRKNLKEDRAAWAIDGRSAGLRSGKKEYIHVFMPRQPDCICVNLRRASRAMTALYDAALAAAGVRLTQFSLLRAVERHEPAPINVLSEDLDLDRTTLARNLAPLEREHLITLTAGEDRRVTEVRLTAKGRSVLAKALPLWQQVQVDVGRRFAAGRLDQLRSIAAEALIVAMAPLPPAKTASQARRKPVAA
jgi:DNA-binding MarR family transcriptional regulator